MLFSTLANVSRGLRGQLGRVARNPNSCHVSERLHDGESSGMLVCVGSTENFHFSYVHTHTIAAGFSDRWCALHDIHKEAQSKFLT